MTEWKKNPAIAVVGAGGVGGYLAAMLANSFENVSLVVRGERKRMIEKNGLMLHCDLNGEVSSSSVKLVESTRELGRQDYIFVSVKNYSLEEILPELKEVAGEDTVLIPVMNGVNPGERIRKAIDRGTVVDSLIYIVAFANPDYSITQQGQFANMRIGIKHATSEEQEKVQAVSEILRRANVQHKISGDIEVDIWRKFILNCAYNVATARYDCPIGGLRNDPVRCREYECLAKEAYQVGVMKGVHLREEYLTAVIDRFYKEYSDEASGSLQRDLHDGKPVELEIFCGYLVEQAKQLGVEVPVTEQMYAALKQEISQRPRKPQSF